MTFTIRDAIKASIEKHGPDLPAKRKKEMEEAFIKMFEEGKMPKDVQGYTPKMMETIYTYGYRLFKSGKYRDALSFFRFLFRKDPTSYRYCFQVAICYHYLKEYDSASAYYIIAGDIDPNNPVPQFHLSDCWVHLGLPQSALLALERTIRLCKDTPQYQPLKERAIAEYNKLQESVNAQEVKGEK